MGKAIILKKKDGEKVYPISASDLIFDPVTKKTVKKELAEKIGDAPSDGKQYARINGGWAEVEEGSFNFLQVNIESNQDGDTTIEAVKATVTYGSESVEVSNGEFISLPENTNVTISFPEVTGYKKPDDIIFVYTNGLVSKFGIYLTELVVVELSADDDSSVSGQIVTINGEAFTYGSSAVQKKIPFGTEYSVSVNDKSGYNTPASQIFTAAKSVRDLKVVYKAKTLGVFIQDIYNRLYQLNEWEGQQTPNGVAVITEQCEFVIALTDVSQSQIMWSYNTGIIEGCSIDNTNPQLHYSGKEDTDAIINFAGYNSEYAALKCRQFRFPNGKNGYLGSCGEWYAVKANKVTIEECFIKLGYPRLGEPGTGAAFKSYWTSTQKNDSYSYNMLAETVEAELMLREGKKTSTYSAWARAFCEL